MSRQIVSEEVARLSAIEEIKALKARYCAFADDGYDPDGIAGLFVEDGVWDGGEAFGRHEGRAKIHAFFSQVSEQIIFAAHLVQNPIIRVEGDRATGSWRLLCPCTTRSEDGAARADWILGSYEDTYVRREGRWWFETLSVDVNFHAPHLAGWVEATT